jgi:hypothetical protein
VADAPFLLTHHEIGSSEEFVTLNRRESGTEFLRGCVLASVVLLTGAGSVVLGVGSGTRPAVAARPASHSPTFARTGSTAAPQRVREAYRGLPLGFEANQGQNDARVKFQARGSGYGLYLTVGEAVLMLQHSALSTQHSAPSAFVVRMKLANANPRAAVTGSDELSGKSNYFIGNDPAKWHRNVPQFARVRYERIYPGIDLVYYGKQGRLEYDFEVAPGADPQQVELNFQGPDEPRLDSSGNLVLATASGEVRLEAPRVYQTIGERQQPVEGRFALRANGNVGFDLGAYDRTRSLIIDPVLTYSTYLGGSGAESCSAILGAAFTPGCPAIAVDSALSAYVAGSTTSTNFPVPAGGASPALKGAANVFITKFNSAGSALLFTTYLGGTGKDITAGIAVNSGFDVIVAGTTTSKDFATIKGYQLTPEAGSAGTQHVFVSELDPTGSSLLYSTYLSGNGNDTASGLALDANGKAYVTGTTTSTDTPSAAVQFPATIGAFQTIAGCSGSGACSSPPGITQFFVTKVDPATSQAASVPYSTYFGGSNPANGVAMGGGVAVDSSNNVYITGGTNFQHTGSNAATDFPILNAAQGCLDLPSAVAPTTAPPCPASSHTDAFVAKLNPAAASGAQLQYSTYVGGTLDDVGYGIAVDTGGDAYITGSTTSTDFVIPASTVPFQQCPNQPTINPVPPPCSNIAGMDAFLAKISSFIPPATTTTTPSTVSLLYFSYLGGTGNDAGLGIAVDSVQGARLTGWTDSADFHTLTPVQAASGGGRDAFAARIDTTATTATAAGHYSTYLGGSGTDMGTGIALDLQGAAYVTGETASPNFTTASPFQAALSGSSDAFVSKLGSTVNLGVTVSASPTPVGVGNNVTFTYIITNNADLTTGVTFSDTLPGASATFVSATASPGSCGSATGGSVQCNIGALNSLSTATVSVVLTPTAGGALGNSGLVTVAGSNFPGVSMSSSAVVNDYRISVAPASVPVMAGAPASYQAQVTPTGSIPETVTLACGSGLPTGATCSFSTNPFPNLNTGPASSVLTIATTARVTTTVDLRHGLRGPFYATWLPVSGLALLGMGLGGKKRRLLMGALLGAFLSLLVFQAGCGTKAATSTTTGTPAGTYVVTVTATSGAASRTATVQLVVQ